jgi:hypothetical protein
MALVMEGFFFLHWWWKAPPSTYKQKQNDKEWKHENPKKKKKSICFKQKIYVLIYLLIMKHVLTIMEMEGLFK